MSPKEHAVLASGKETEIAQTFSQCEFMLPVLK